MHLICDFRSGNVKLMRDVEGMKEWLSKLAGKIGMTVQGEVVVRPYPFPKSHDWSALSAVCFLAESSITIHCYPEKHYVYLDVFSCKSFETTEVFEYIGETFLAKSVETLLLARGLDDQAENVLPLRILEFVEIDI